MLGSGFPRMNSFSPARSDGHSATDDSENILSDNDNTEEDSDKGDSTGEKSPSYFSRNSFSASSSEIDSIIESLKDIAKPASDPAEQPRFPGFPHSRNTSYKSQPSFHHRLSEVAEHRTRELTTQVEYLEKVNQELEDKVAELEMENEDMACILAKTYKNIRCGWDVD
eukprot:UN28122